MKRLIPMIALLGLLMTACAPHSFTTTLQVRQPSRSGLDLTKKTMSVVYLSDADSTVEHRALQQASRLAGRLESNYFEDTDVVGFFKLDKDPAGEYSHRDTLIRMVVGTGDDVVFLVDTPTDATAYNVYVLDSMSGSDEVKKYAGASGIGEEFIPDWKTCVFTILYFDSSSSWSKASQLAYENKWADAMEIWMDLAKSCKSPIRRAGACYDTAIACFLLGDKALALKWLDRADASCKLDESPSLRKLLNSMK